MQKLRSIHLYLGCIFAPLLLFFAASGIWQTLGLHSEILAKLSSLHTGARWKNGSEWSSFPFKIVVVVMSLSFVATTILGIVMALKFGRSRKAAIYCFAAGIIVPVLLVLLHLAGKS